MNKPIYIRQTMRRLSNHHMSSTASTTSSSTQRPGVAYRAFQSSNAAVDPEKSGIQVTPAVLRSIFANSRSPVEERSISRIAFFRSVSHACGITGGLTRFIDMARFAGWLLSIVGISMAAARNRALKNSATLLGVI